MTQFEILQGMKGGLWEKAAFGFHTKHSTFLYVVDSVVVYTNIRFDMLACNSVSELLSGKYSLKKLIAIFSFYFYEELAISGFTETARKALYFSAGI